MNKFCGAVGYAQTVEARPGVFQLQVTERKQRGDVLRQIHRWENGETRNDDLNVNHQISIVADEFAVSHCSDIRYVQWMGTKWKVTGIDVRHPRLILTLGGVYHGDTP